MHLLLAALLTVVPEVSAQPERVGVSVWVEPALPAFLWVGSAIAGSRMLSVPVGASYAIGPHALVLELSYQDYSGRSGGTGPFVTFLRSFIAAFGIEFHLSQGTAIDGLFLAPKLQAHVGFDLDEPGQTMWTAEFGLDVGYRFRVDHFYGAVLIGGTVGYGYFPTTLSGPLGLGQVPPREQVVASPNFNVLRIGGTF